MFRGELGLGPLDGGRGVFVHVGVLADRRGVVVPEDGDRASLHVSHHRINDPTGVGAVAHVVAEEDVFVDPVALGVLETGLEGLAIGMDVADERYSHGFS